MNVFIKSIEMNERKVKAGRKENEILCWGLLQGELFQGELFQGELFQGELFQGELLQRKPSQWSLLPWERDGCSHENDFRIIESRELISVRWSMRFQVLKGNLAQKPDYRQLFSRNFCYFEFFVIKTDSVTEKVLPDRDAYQPLGTGDRFPAFFLHKFFLFAAD